MLSPIRTTWMYFPERIGICAGVWIIINILLTASLRRGRLHRAGAVKKAAGILLINYEYLLCFFTVLGRRSLDYYRFDFQLGDSWRQAFLQGDSALFRQILANVAVFIPVGFLLILLWMGRRRCFLRSLGCGVLLSCAIELIQFVWRRGMCEVDDVVGNTVGLLIGCLLAMAVTGIRKRHP